MTRILAQVTIAPHAPTLTNPNGLDKRVNAVDGLAKLMAYACPKSIRDRVDGLFWNHPFAKWSRVPWLNPMGVLKRTGMRLDALQLATANLPWLVDAFDGLVQDDTDHIYTGGVPPMPLRFTGLDRYIDRNIRVWFDGISANGGTQLHHDVWQYHRDGKPVGAEANRMCVDFTMRELERTRGFPPVAFGSVPVIARADMWRNTANKSLTHWPWNNAPPRSAAWFQHGIRDADDIALLKQVKRSGLDTIVVNFAPTTAADLTGHVFEIVRAV